MNLQPPGPDASVEELLLRNYILASMMPVLGEAASNAAMNAAAPVIQRYALMFTSSLQALWTLLQANKRTMDFTVKANLVFDTIVSARAAGASTETGAPTSADIAQICAEIVPLAGSLVGTKLTPVWQAACQVDDEIISELIPQIDPQTGQLSFQPYATFFHLFDESCEDEIDAEAMNVSQAKDTVDRMVGYQTASLDNLNDLLLEVLKDWSSTKALVLNSDQRHELNINSLKHEAERMQQEDRRRIETLEKYIDSLTGRLQESMTKIDEQQLIIDQVHNLEKHIHGKTSNFFLSHQNINLGFTELRGHQHGLRDKKTVLEDELQETRIREQANSRELVAVTSALHDCREEIRNMQNRSKEQEILIQEQGQEILTLRAQIQEYERVVSY